MSILVNEHSKVVVQGITGREGMVRTRLMTEYGTRVVAGVTPGKGGQDVLGVPVFDSVEEAWERTGAIDVSVKMSAGTFMLLREGMMTVEYAQAARLLSWEGEAEHCARLMEAFGTAHRVVRGG